MRLHTQEENREMPAFSTTQNPNQPAATKDNGAKKREPRLPTPIEIASLFTEKFYSRMKSSRETLFQFFGDDSHLASGYQGEKVKVGLGQEEIHRRFQEPDYKVMFTDVTCVDALGIGNGQVMIQATGLYETADGDQHNFYESFVLAPQNGGGFYVLANIRRVSRETITQKEAVSPVISASKSAHMSSTSPKTPIAEDYLQKEEPVKSKTQNATTNSTLSASAAPVEAPVVIPPVSSEAGKRGDSKRTPKTTLNENIKSTKGSGITTPVVTPGPEVAKPSPAIEASPASDSAKKPAKASDAIPASNPVSTSPTSTISPTSQGAPATQSGSTHTGSGAPPSTVTAPAAQAGSTHSCSGPPPSTATAPAAASAAAPAPPRSWASAAANNPNASWDKKNIAEVKGMSTRPSQHPTKTSPPPSAHGQRRNGDLANSVYVKGVNPHSGVTKPDLQDAFSQYGEVVGVELLKSAGAYVTFASQSVVNVVLGKQVTLRNGVHVVAEPKRVPVRSGSGPGRGGGGPRGSGQSGRGGDRSFRRRGS